MAGEIDPEWSEYEKQSNEYAANALRAMTYLNGGGLVAIPAAAALFKTDLAAPGAKLVLLGAGVAFVVGLILIAACQGFAFFVYAKRSEAKRLKKKDPWEEARKFRKIAIWLFGGSFVFFIAGCFAGIVALHP
jgi:Na+-transporting methylmalonyl-CoA/oxaloacetate decarboxylase gamma subunit